LVTGPNPGPEGPSPFHVPAFLDALGGVVHRFRNFWLWLGRLESSTLAEQLREVPIRAPIWVCGLARSGSTLLHEVISAHPGVATHRMKDYPMLFTPYWWRQATANLRPQPPRERRHRDGVLITTESPDALEEMLWMAFFPRCHDPTVSNLLRGADRHPAFESFFRLHIRKLLLAETASRYAAKANGHIARLPYLLRLFPDARFVIPVRSPAAHVESLLRQHRWFSQGERKHRRALAYMQRTGHFEFGLDRRPLNLGDGNRARQVLKAWAAGDEVRGLAIYWDMVHRYLADLLASNEALRRATRVVPFEGLCAAPVETLHTVLEHCALPDAEGVIAGRAAAVRSMSYYKSALSADDLSVVHEETIATARLWGF
jgi:hypothetical protein